MVPTITQSSDFMGHGRVIAFARLLFRFFPNGATTYKAFVLWFLSRITRSKNAHMVYGNVRHIKKQKVKRKYFQKSMEQWFIGQTLVVSPTRISKKMMQVHAAVVLGHREGKMNGSESSTGLKSNKTTSFLLPHILKTVSSTLSTSES